MIEAEEKIQLACKEFMLTANDNISIKAGGNIDVKSGGTIAEQAAGDFSATSPKLLLN